MTASNPWAQTSSPWGKPSSVQPCSLEDVMSEQLARELQQEEEDSLNQRLQVQDSLKSSEAAGDVCAPQPEDTEKTLSDAEIAAKLAAEDVGYDPNDEVIARMLQKEFDREYDADLTKREQFFNGNSKVSISFENYKRKNQQAEYQNADDDDDDDDFYAEEKPEYPLPTKWEVKTPNFGSKGYSGQGKNIVTKHDKVICGRKNAERLMQFPPDFGCGDGEGMDMQLPNKVYNKLKNHSQSESKKGNKVHEKKDHSTAIKAVDEKTRILIFKMINSGFLTSVDGVVSEGKEAVVFKAIGGEKEDVKLPHDVILKVYKTSLNEFKTRLKYIVGDYRLSKDILKRYNPRKMMRMWAEKEFLNLKKLMRHGVPCPTPLALKRHVLAMSCIGGPNPAPKLRDVDLSMADLEDAYQQSIELMKSMYHDCQMVHADFSPYNLLWHDGKVWVIDVGQAVDRENVNSSSFLLRDCKNICDYFKHGGVHNVPSAEDLFNDITQYSIQGEGTVFESQVQRYKKDETYAFDYFFELTSSARLQKLDIDDSDSESGEDYGDDNLKSEEQEVNEACDDGDSVDETINKDLGVDGGLVSHSVNADSLVVVD